MEEERSCRTTKSETTNRIHLVCALYVQREVMRRGLRRSLEILLLGGDRSTDSHEARTETLYADM